MYVYKCIHTYLGTISGVFRGCVFFSGLLRFLDSSIRHQGNSVGADGDASNLLVAYGGFLKLGVLLKIPKVHQF